MTDVEKSRVTPEAVLALTCPMPGYALQLSDNEVGLDFLEFMIKDEKSGEVFFEVKRDQTHQPPTSALPDDLPEEVEDMVRHVRYNVPKGMLQCKFIQTRLKFMVGRDVPKLRLIERHYFKDRLLKEYDMEFGPCSAGVCHCWNAQYPMPETSAAQIAEYVQTPGGHVTDSFYFAGDRLVVHNKATFTYTEEVDSLVDGMGKLQRA